MVQWGVLGTYMPIVLPLTLARNLDPGTTLIFTGIYNIVTGAIYDVPMQVQPLKSITAITIANPDFEIPKIMAAGIFTAGVLFVLGVTQIMDFAQLEKLRFCSQIDHCRLFDLKNELDIFSKNK